MAKKPLSIVDLNYSTSQNAMVDTINGNMGKIKQYLMNLSASMSGVYLESGTAAYNYTAAVTLTFVNSYTVKPVVTVSAEYSPTDFPSPLVPAFQLVQTGGVYTGVVVTPHSDNLPAVATAYFHVHAECRGAVVPT